MIDSGRLEIGLLRNGNRQIKTEALTEGERSCLLSQMFAGFLQLAETGGQRNRGRNRWVIEHARETKVDEASDFVNHNDWFCSLLSHCLRSPDGRRTEERKAEGRGIKKKPLFPFHSAYDVSNAGLRDGVVSCCQVTFDLVFFGLSSSRRRETLHTKAPKTRQYIHIYIYI